MKRNPCILLLILLLVPAVGSGSTLFRALEDELERNSRKLYIEQHKPYYISYRVEDYEYMRAEASFGALVYSNHRRDRSLAVDVRIGNYDFDNSNFLFQPSYSRLIDAGTTSLPLHDDYDALRGDIWLVTDGTYKRALEQLSRKKATIQNQQIKERPSDFSRVSDCSITESEEHLSVTLSDWERRVIELSALFRTYPKIQESSVSFYTRVNNQSFVDTERKRNTEAKLLTYIEISAKTQSDDGDPIEDVRGFYCHTPEGLPSLSVMKKTVEALAETLSMQADLEKAEDYSGPVLFVGQAAAEFIFQLLGKGVSDPRSPLLENEMLARGLSEDMGMLTRRIGRRVFPDFLEAYDDPTLAAWDGIPLVGHFLVDDEGVCAERVELVSEKGKLTSVLMSRAPIKKVENSNGHGRFRAGSYLGRVSGMVGNLIVQPKEGEISPDLKGALLDICKDYEIPYGIMVTRLSPARPKTMRERYMRYFTAMAGGGKDTPLLSSVVTAYRVDGATGKIELIRGLEFSAVTTRALRDIVAVGEEEYVYNFVYYDDQGNAFPMSVVAPALLVEEMELESSDKKAKKLPILSHPYFK